MKRNKGITLIALVITIIVLLILVGVAIAMLSGENGILKKAADAKEKTGEAKRDETSKLSQYEGLLNNYSGNKWCLDGKGNVTNGTTTIKLGSQINYDPYTGVEKDYLKVTSYKTRNGYKDQTFQLANNEDGKQKLVWKVLGVDDNGQILIMPTTNIKNADGEVQRLSLGSKLAEAADFSSDESKKAGALAVEYGKEEINNICSIYGFGKGATGARSVQVEDIDKIAKFEKTKFEPNQVYGYGHEVEYTLVDGKVNYKLYGESSPVVSDYTSLTYVQGGQYKDLKVGETLKLKNTYYNYVMTTEPYKTNLGNVYNLVAEGTNSNQNYWLGSSCIFGDTGYVYWGIFYVVNYNVDFGYLFDTDGKAYADTRGLRPAVSLKLDIELKETAENSGIYDIQ